ncbi:unnamed protein product [Closterium sp. NIES-64]|nr:unnamed protein product [Closterium sp. NIES-64]
MEVARTSMIRVAAPHFLWSFAVQYAAHQLNLWSRVSLPETSPTLHGQGRLACVGVPSRGCRAFVRDTSADKLSSRAAPCVFLGFVLTRLAGSFYHPTSHHVLPSQDVTFDESVPFYRLFPYRTAHSPPPPPPLLPHPRCPVGSYRLWSCARVLSVLGLVVLGSGGTETGGAKRGGAETGGAEAWGLGVLSLGGAEPGGAPSLQQLREWYSQSYSLQRGATGAGDSAGVRAGGPAGAVSRPEPPSLQWLREWLLELLGGAASAGAAGGAARAARGTGAAGGGAGAGPARGAAGAVGGTGAAGGAAGAAGGAAGAGPARGASGAARGTWSSWGLLGGPTGTEAGGTARAGTGGVAFVALRVLEPTVRLEVLVLSAASSGATSWPRPECPSSSPPASSLRDLADPESDSLRAASTTVMRILATVVTDPSFESTVASALVAELVDFAAHCRLDYAASLDRQEEFECFAAAVPHLVSCSLHLRETRMLQASRPRRSYAEAIAVSTPLEWQTTMDTEMPSWKSTGTYVDQVPPPGANTVSGMWIFRITTLQVLLHVAAQRDYELHSLNFSTPSCTAACTRRSGLRRPSGFTGSFPPGTQWSLRRPVYGLRQAPHKWNDTLRTTLAALGFAPSTADPSLFLRTDTSLPPFYILMYVDDLVFATADTEALAHVKSELQKRHTCEAEIYAIAMAAQELRWLTYLLTDLGEWPRSPLVLYVDNKAAIALCEEHRLEHRTKHIALRYFLARELQQRGQLCLRYVATQANTANIFTKALQSGDHQRVCTMLELVPTFPHLL